MPPPPLPAISIIKRARKLLRCGKITHRDFAVMDALVWCCRSPTSRRREVTISLTSLAKLVHCARSTVAAAVSRLEAVGILSRIRRYALFPWACGGRQARQIANCYILRHESDSASANHSDSILITTPAVSSYIVEAAKSALEARRQVIEGRLLLNKAV